jgi:hypothetical protein
MAFSNDSSNYFHLTRKFVQLFLNKLHDEILKTRKYLNYLVRYRSKIFLKIELVIPKA